MEPIEQQSVKMASHSGVRRGLGRGLDALLPSAPPAGDAVRQIPVSAILPNPFQPRQQFDAQRLA